ncbi:galactose-1-phosphate uridylyltransferase [Dissulfurispira thermophila]|uniref:Galactose-1-phosphate uridylyltransferase n=2 Tax=root TaxID=1 RepID=A0A7G1GZK9_9BACT|nr:galactose-1-phosphate uridylyltransferase [Dissulfurispira thermophila]BCB95930.1 galactose-1-phosphate uridylyltransferase [Dissulfurispira thermophila]
MPELRLNLITREWVIIAREKGKMPEDFIGARERKRLPEFIETCPFCPGNEAKTPYEQYRISDEKGWKIRVVPNKFAVLSKEGERQRINIGLKKSVNGVGLHEIIIESPVHNLTTATMPVEQLKEVIQAYKDRFIEIYNDSRIEHVIIFKNSGTASGTTIEHPHSQIVGIPVTPLQIRGRIENSMRYFDDTGECLLCNTLNDEINDGSRILCNTDHFVSFVPYAALSAFHIWIFPKRHSGSFSDIKPDEMWDLSINLKKTMSMLYYGLEHPDFNYVIRSGKPSNSSSEFIHWYISIVPRVAMASGFELGSGMYINPLMPEMSAEFLRSVKIPS